MDDHMLVKNEAPRTIWVKLSEAFFSIIVGLSLGQMLCSFLFFFTRVTADSVSLAVSAPNRLIPRLPFNFVLGLTRFFICLGFIFGIYMWTVISKRSKRITLVWYFVCGVVFCALTMINQQLTHNLWMQGL